MRREEAVLKKFGLWDIKYDDSKDFYDTYMEPKTPVKATRHSSEAAEAPEWYLGYSDRTGEGAPVATQECWHWRKPPGLEWATGNWPEASHIRRVIANAIKRNQRGPNNACLRA